MMRVSRSQPFMTRISVRHFAMTGDAAMAAARLVSVKVLHLRQQFADLGRVGALIHHCLLPNRSQLLPRITRIHWPSSLIRHVKRVAPPSEALGIRNGNRSPPELVNWLVVATFTASLEATDCYRSVPARE
jgi:hypothetical protein